MCSHQTNQVTVVLASSLEKNENLKNLKWNYGEILILIKPLKLHIVLLILDCEEILCVYRVKNEKLRITAS